MAKLFEEVIGGASHKSSADIIVHFASCGDQGTPYFGSPPPAANCREACSSSPGGPHGGAQMSRQELCASSRGAAFSPRSSPANRPTRGASIMGESGMHAMPPSIRCHTLVLRTQPALMEKLIPGAVREGRSETEYVVSPAALMSDSQPDHASGRSESVEGSPTRGCLTFGTYSQGSPRRGSDIILEVTVDDEPEVFLELVKFVYLNTCHVDHSNVKSLMQMADKYGVEDIIMHCLQWMQDHFTAAIFYHFLSFKLSNRRFAQLLHQSLLKALRSRRHFTLVSEGLDGQWEQLSVPFVEALLSFDELPVVSESEVMYLLVRWATGSLARQVQDRGSPVQRAREPPTRMGLKDSLVGLPPVHRQVSGHETGQLCPPLEEAETGGLEVDSVSLADVSDPSDTTADGVGRCQDSLGDSLTDYRRGSNASGTGGDDPVAGARSPDADSDANGGLVAPDAMEQARTDMLRLLRTVRRSDMLLKVSEVEPILQILGLHSLFSTKPPRESSTLDPGFMIYRGVAGVNVPANFGELHQPNVVPHALRGGSVSLGCHDFMQQQDGFRPSSVPDGSIRVFPRLRVRITCSSWSHREKRFSKSSTGMARHNIAGPIGADVPAPSWESVGSSLMGMPPVNEAGPPEKGPQTLKTMQSQDDLEIGRKHPTRSGGAVPNLQDNEKIDHKVVCAVISGHMRHGIRIGQRERSSIYDIEELYGQCEEVCLGGSPTEVEFELLLTVHAPSHCGICRCSLAVLRSEVSGGGGPSDRMDPLLEVSFDASAEEHLHFYVSSTHFDSNSSYSVALNWVLRAGIADS